MEIRDSLFILKSIPVFQMLERLLLKACGSNIILAMQRKKLPKFGDAFLCSRFFQTAKQLRFSAITLVNLSEKTCEILGSFLQDNALLLPEIAKIVQKVQEKEDFGRFWQETSDFCTFPARNVC